jgi:hypothetical protein
MRKRSTKNKKEKTGASQMSEEEIKASGHHPADTNGDGDVSKEEHDMFLEFKRKELEDADAMRDAQRTMAWYSLGGMLLYPVIVVLATVFNMDQAAKILGDMAGVYFIAVAGIVAAFFGAQALTKKK